MAKKFRRMMALAMALVLCFAQMAMPANAWSNHGGGQQSSQYEWYQVYVQGNLVAEDSGRPGNNLWLGRTYNASYSVSNGIMTWYIRPNGGNSGNFSGTVDLTQFITIPAGYSVADVEIETGSIEGVNSESNQYDNAIISITIKSLKDEEGEVVSLRAVTVNHNYYTKDLYTNETVLDGSTSGSSEALEGSSYTATPVTTYGGNAYEQTTDASALTITVHADANNNVINIDYLRTIDTTPEPVQTSVTVNHNYYTKDLYTNETVLDGSTSGTESALENDVYTATSVTTYGENTYTQTTDNAELTITVVADASKNVININYLRTIDTTPVDYEPVLSVVKTADKAVYEIGETITWTITVSNNSDYTAYNVSVVDELVNGSWTVESLAPGASQSFTVTTVAEAAGTINNVAVASWTDGDEIPDEEEDEPTSTRDDETVTVNEPPVPPTPPELVDYETYVAVTKSADKEVYEVGETITWTITVENVSDYLAYNVDVVDPVTDDSWYIDYLIPGASKTFTVTTIAEEVGPMANSVVATWTDGDQIPDADEPDEEKESSDEAVVIVEEPEVTEPEVTEPEVTEPEVTEPEVTEPEVTEPADDDNGIAVVDGYVEINDEDVPLADVPQTGDVSILWAALSLVSGGVFVLNKKREEEE